MVSSGCSLDAHRVFTGPTVSRPRVCLNRSCAEDNDPRRPTPVSAHESGLDTPAECDEPVAWGVSARENCPIRRSSPTNSRSPLMLERRVAPLKTPRGSPRVSVNRLARQTGVPFSCGRLRALFGRRPWCGEVASGGRLVRWSSRAGSSRGHSWYPHRVPKLLCTRPRSRPTTRSANWWSRRHPFSI